MFVVTQSVSLQVCRSINNVLITQDMWVQCSTVGWKVYDQQYRLYKHNIHRKMQVICRDIIPPCLLTVTSNQFHQMALNYLQLGRLLVSSFSASAFSLTWT